jgi:hypothetical protein
MVLSPELRPRNWAQHLFAGNKLAVYCDRCYRINLFEIKIAFFSKKVSYVPLGDLAEREFQRRFGMSVVPGSIREQPSERLFSEIVALYFGQSESKTWAGARDEVFAIVLSKLTPHRAFEFLSDQLDAAYEGDQGHNFAAKLNWFISRFKGLAANDAVDPGTRQRANAILLPIEADLMALVARGETTEFVD